jgi:WD40 repeat protein
MCMRALSLTRGNFVVACLLGTLATAPSRGEGRLDRDGNPLPAGAIARLGTLTLRSCGDPMLYAPSGKYFVSTSGPSRSQIAFFDPNSGRRLFEIDTSGTGSHLVFSPDGKRLACPLPGGYHNQVWAVDSRKLLFDFEGSQACFSADGSKLITVSFYGKGHCRVLDSHSGEVLKEHRLEAALTWAEFVPGDTKVVFRDNITGRTVLFDWGRQTRAPGFACEKGYGATASPDGKTLALANRQGIRLVDLVTGAELGNWKQRADGLAVFAPDGRRLAWSGYDERRGIAYPWIVEIAGDTPRRAGLPSNNFAPPCFTPDGEALVVLDDGGIPVWRDVQTGKEIRPRDGHSGAVWEVMPTPDGRHLLSRDLNRQLVWDLHTARLVKRYPDELPSGETPLYTPLNRGTSPGHMLTLHEGTGVLRLRDFVSGRQLLQLEGNHGFASGHVHPAVVARDGKSAVLVSRDYQIRVYDLDNGKLRITYHPRAAILSLDFSEDGRYLSWVTQGRPGGDGPFFLDTHTGREVSDPKTFRLGPARQWTYSGQEEGLKHLIDRNLVDSAGRRIDRTWPKSLFDIVISPDARYLALHYSDVPPGQKGEGRLGLWDLATGKPLSHVQLQQGTIRFSPDCRLLVTTTLEGSLDVWEIATGQKRLSLKGHLPGEIPALAFLPSGRTLASGGRDGQVLLWDLTGRSPDGTWHNARHDPARLKELWAALAAGDTTLAHRAIWELIADPAGSVSFLAERLRPVPVIDAKLAAKLIADLDSATFSTRQRASTDLAKWGEAALPEIRAAVKNPSSLEQARRLKPLLADLERQDLSSDRLRGVRAIEVLEWIDTAEARRILDNLAHGFATARLTKEAKKALKRYP